MNAPRLMTERLVLRRMMLADAPALHEAFADPEVMAYWSSPPHATLGDTEAWIADTMAAISAGTSDDFAITLSGQVIGKAGLWMGDEVGVLLRRSAWGRGYAREAMTAVIDRAFAMGIPAITADVDPRNAASRRLLERLGFRKTGEAKATFEIGGVWTDSVFLTLSAPHAPPGDQ
jgi:[ribosomal protein S5]-alanine N-acetyltransferase